MSQILISALRETLYMVFAAGLISVLIGIPLGILTAKTVNGYSRITQWFHAMLYALIQVAKSLPYLLVMLLFIPMTNWLINRGISYTTATLLPLGVTGGLILAQNVYDTLLQLNAKWHGTGKAMGATPRQTLLLMVLPEAVWPIVQATANTLSLIVGFTIVAGALGAGGLGQLAIEKSINQPNPLQVIICIAVLVALQQLIKYTGTLVAQHTR